MPYSKEETERLAALRSALKKYSNASGFNTKAKRHLDTYHDLKSALKRAKKEEDFIRIVDQLTVLVRDAHKDCLDEISDYESNKGWGPYMGRAAIDGGKVVAEKVNGALDYVSGALHYVLPSLPKMEKLKIPVTTINDTLASLGAVRDFISECKARVDKLIDVFSRDQRPDDEELEELKRPLGAESIQAEGQELRDTFVKRALEKYDSTLKVLITPSNAEFIKFLPCTAAYIRILSGIGGVSKYNPEERLLPGGFIGRLFNLLALVILKRIGDAGNSSR